MSRPLRRGRLDVLDRLRPGLADQVRSTVAGAVPDRLRPAADHERVAGLAAVARLLAAEPGPGQSATAAVALDAALSARERWPGAAADRLVVAAAGRVRADGAPAPVAPGLVDVPADEAARLAARLAPPPAGQLADPC
jgi:hypothetical protein